MTGEEAADAKLDLRTRIEHFFEIQRRTNEARIAELERELLAARLTPPECPQTITGSVAAERERCLRECIAATKSAALEWGKVVGHPSAVLALNALAKDFEIAIRNGKP